VLFSQKSAVALLSGFIAVKTAYKKMATIAAADTSYHNNST